MHSSSTKQYRSTPCSAADMLPFYSATPLQNYYAVDSEETLAEIGRSYNVSGWTISRLAP